MASLLLPLLLFLVAATVVAGGMLVAGSLFGPQRQSRVKRMPYESGMDPIHDARRRFDVRFYLVAIAFLVFDVELLFLYPWAVASKYSWDTSSPAADSVSSLAADGFSSGLVFAEVSFFLVLLALGWVYAWRRGVFRWR